jgi:hypothetical protein
MGVAMTRVQEATIEYLAALNAEMIRLAEKADLDTLGHLYRVSQSELEALGKSQRSQRVAA